MSAAISAYPSMAELSNGGSGRLAVMSSASTEPSASAMPSWVGGNGRIRVRMSWAMGVDADQVRGSHRGGDPPRSSRQRVQGAFAARGRSWARSGRSGREHHQGPQVVQLVPGVVAPSRKSTP